MKFRFPLDEVEYGLEAVLDLRGRKGVSTQSMFKALVEKSTDIILITGRDFVIKYITGSVEKLLGVKPEQALGRDLFEFVEINKANSLRNFVKRGVIREDKFSEVSLNNISGEKRFFDVTISNLLDNNKVNGLVINLHDITERKLTEQKLLKANNELDHFIYKTSHDLRAPLLSAIGLVELAEKDPERDKFEYLKLIRKSLVQLDSFIEDINSFYRNEKLAVRKEQIDLNDIVNEEIDRLTGIDEVASRIRINYNLDSSSELYSDSIRLKTVITNVLSNAIKYSDKTKVAPYINIDIKVTQNACHMQVEDNGIGIRPEYLNNIFDIFYRADENAKGSGLGLYIVKDTVDKLNGQIEVRSDHGKGTTFTISVPNFLNFMKKLDCDK